jgi:hypothetical protein
MRKGIRLVLGQIGKCIAKQTFYGTNDPAKIKAFDGIAKLRKEIAYPIMRTVITLSKIGIVV